MRRPDLQRRDDPRQRADAAAQAGARARPRRRCWRYAGLRRLASNPTAGVVLDPEVMVPAAGQGIVGVTVRADDTELLELLAAIEDPEARAVSTAERALLAALDGSCRTPIGGHARLLDEAACT